MNRDFEKTLRELRIVASMVLILVLTFQFVRLPAGIEFQLTHRLDPALSRVNKALDNVDSTTSRVSGLVEEVSKDYYDPASPGVGFYWDIFATLESSTASSKKTYDVLKNIDGLIGDVRPQVALLLGDAMALVSDLRNDINGLTQTSSEVLNDLRGPIDNINQLTAQLVKELAAGGDINKTFAALAESVAAFDKIANDPNVAANLAHSEQITKHLASTAETLDDVTLPWRKKANQLKLILEKLADILKVTVPLPWKP